MCIYVPYGLVVLSHEEETSALGDDDDETFANHDFGHRLIDLQIFDLPFCSWRR